MSARTPPRFVPTLTDVVRLPASARALPVQAAAAPAGPLLPGPLPAEIPAPVASAPALDRVPAAAPVPALAQDFEEGLVHRVLQRVDGLLEQRLRGAIAPVVEVQTRVIAARLREEVEAVVRDAVYEAVAQELQTSDGPAPQQGGAADYPISGAPAAPRG